MYRKLSAAILLVTTSFTAYQSLARTRKESHELNESCGKRAAEKFKQEYGTGFSSDSETRNIYSYRNHYSPRLNKCWYLVQTRATFQRGEKPEQLALALYDLNDRERYAIYMAEGEKVYLCEAMGQECSSQDQWMELVSPYLND
jgi:hypothetical protein